MSHLSEEQLRAAVLSESARAHLEDCAVCELRAAGLGEVVAAAMGLDRDRLGPVRAPDFDRLLGPVLAEPPVEPAASWRDSLSLAGQLLRWQWRLLPRALVLAGVAGFAAVVAVVLGLPGQSGGGGVFGAMVSLLLLLGVVWGCEPERGRRSELALTLPVSPAMVFLARLTLVLGLGLALAVAGSAVVWAAGSPSTLPGLVASWLGPSLLSAAVATVLAVWRAPWPGLTGGVLVWAAGWLVTRGAALHPEAGLAAALRLVWPTTPVTMAVAVALFALAVRMAARAGREPRVAGAV
ncbi:hypothetical protein [Crossiella sp. NPDC003009]